MITERVGTEIGLMTGRIKQSLQNGKENISDLQSSVTANTRRAVRKTDYYVHDNAWKVIGIAAGVALVAGFLLSRRNQGAIAARVDADALPQMDTKARNPNAWEFVHSALPLALLFWKSVQNSRQARKSTPPVNA